MSRFLYDTLTSMANLGSTYRNQGRWTEAVMDGGGKAGSAPTCPSCRGFISPSSLSSAPRPTIGPHPSLRAAIDEEGHQKGVDIHSTLPKNMHHRRLPPQPTAHCPLSYLCRLPMHFSWIQSKKFTIRILLLEYYTLKKNHSYSL